MLEMLQGDENILDLGCGNGELARALGKRNHHGAYLGVDFSLPLLRDAESQPEHFTANFMEVDLTLLSENIEKLMVKADWSWITAFAVLHHIPSHQLRLDIIKAVHDILQPNGLFIHSNWQFLNSERLKARIKPWDVAAIQKSDVDAGDFLIDWRSGGNGLRYVHHFDEVELQDLADTAGFQIAEGFYSDGETGNLGLYQVWKPRP